MLPFAAAMLLVQAAPDSVARVLIAAAIAAVGVGGMLWVGPGRALRASLREAGA
jgi:hypothetical protein